MKRSPVYALVVSGPYIGAKVTASPNRAMKPHAHQILDGSLKGRWITLDQKEYRPIKPCRKRRSQP